MNTSNLESFKLPKKASKFHKRYLKAFLRKLGLESQFPKFNKTPLFWAFMNEDVVVFDFIQEDFEMPPHLLEEMERFFVYYVHMMKYPIPERDLTLSLYETLEMARRFRHAARGTLKKGTKVHELCEEWIEHLWKFEVLDLATQHMRRGLLLISTLFSYTDDWIYSYDIETANHPSNPFRMRFKVTILRRKAAVYNRTGEYLRRYYLFEYGEGDGSFNHKTCSYEGKSYPVYYQSHALKRVQERVHFKRKQVHYQILLHVNYNDVRTYKSSYLIPLYANGDHKDKIGYFAGEFFDERFLINTFLFLSQDGTPEGDKLNELLKVKKLEKKYLQLDKLRYFTNSDLKDDEDFLPLLKTCHLDHLLEFRVADPEMGFTTNADFIKETLEIKPVAM